MRKIKVLHSCDKVGNARDCLIAQTDCLIDKSCKTKAVTLRHSLLCGNSLLSEKREVKVISDRYGNRQILARIFRSIDEDVIVSTVSRMDGSDVRKVETELAKEDAESFYEQWSRKS